LDQAFIAIKKRWGIHPSAELKHQHYGAAWWRSEEELPDEKRFRSIRYLGRSGVVGATQEMVGAICAVPKARTLAVCVRRSVVYSTWWLKRPNARTAKDGWTRPSTVYRYCLQELYERAHRDARQPDPRPHVKAYLDRHDALQSDALLPGDQTERGWSGFAEIHRWLLTSSWGEPLTEIDPDPAVLPSNRCMGLQAVDFAAGAYYSWLWGWFPPAYAPLTRLVRRVDGRLLDYGIRCVPHKDAFLDEELCQRLLSAAKGANSTSAQAR
jgi:hypothetical protein